MSEFHLLLSYIYSQILFIRLNYFPSDKKKSHMYKKKSHNFLIVNANFFYNYKFKIRNRHK